MSCRLTLFPSYASQSSLRQLLPAQRESPAGQALPFTTQTGGEQAVSTASRAQEANSKTETPLKASAQNPQDNVLVCLRDLKGDSRYLVAFWKNLVRGAVIMPFIVAGLGLGACSGDPAPTAIPQVEKPAKSTDINATGANLYVAHCQSCHGDRDGNGTTTGAPAHDHGGHTWHHPDAQLKDWIMNGKLGFGQMPAFQDKLSESEVDAILSYIKTWWEEWQRESQEDISQRYQEALDRQKEGQ